MKQQHQRAKRCSKWRWRREGRDQALEDEEDKEGEDGEEGRAHDGQRDMEALTKNRAGLSKKGFGM